MVSMVETPIQKSDYTAIQFPKDIVERLKQFTETKNARKMGLTNKAQVAKFAALEFLKKYAVEKEPIRFVLPSLEDDELRIDVHIFSDRIKCNRCIGNQESCKHIDLIHENKEVKKHLKNSKIVIPNRK